MMLNSLLQVTQCDPSCLVIFLVSKRYKYILYKQKDRKANVLNLIFIIHQTLLCYSIRSRLGLIKQGRTMIHSRGLSFRVQMSRAVLKRIVPFAWRILAWAAWQNVVAFKRGATCASHHPYIMVLVLVLKNWFIKPSQRFRCINKLLYHFMMIQKHKRDKRAALLYVYLFERAVCSFYYVTISIFLMATYNKICSVWYVYKQLILCLYVPQ